MTLFLEKVGTFYAQAFSKEKNNCHEILQKEQYINQFDKVVESSKRQFKGLKEWMEIEKKKGL